MALLTKKVMNELRQNTSLRLKIAIATGKHPTTIDRWVENESKNLTLITALNVISKETGIPVQDVVKDNEGTVSK